VRNISYQEKAVETQAEIAGKVGHRVVERPFAWCEIIPSFEKGNNRISTKHCLPGLKKKRALNVPVESAHTTG
jgi:hypothetical protein